MHSYYVKAKSLHQSLIIELSVEVGLAYNEFDCHKFRHMNALLGKLKVHKNREKLFEILKKFILYCIPHKLGVQIEGYAKELSHYLRKKDQVDNHAMYLLGGYLLKDYKYDGDTDDSYFIAKYKELCLRS